MLVGSVIMFRTGLPTKPTADGRSEFLFDLFDWFVFGKSVVF